MVDKIMFKEIKFALYSIKKNFQSSAELRTSFLMNIIGMAINNTAFIFLWVYFIKAVGVIGGWTAWDIIGLQGFLAISYGLVLSGAYGLRKLPDCVASGAFDRFMLSPKNLILRIATSSISTSALGDVVFGIICIVVYAFIIHISIYQILIVLLLILLATIIFLAMTILISAVSFLFTDASAVHDGMFELFFTPALFHGGAFQGGMRFVFTFIIPSLLIGTIPVETLKDTSISKLVLLIILAVFWSVLSVFLFKRAVRKYESSNFMTFGN
jgi:ABC-2 type transport system permease protein